jgi:energy-coupling factor transporter ATP-binding protein EcfA2
MRASAVDAGADAGRDALTMRGAAALAYAEAALDALEGTLAGAPDWRPGRALRAEVAWCRERLGELTEAWGSKLVVAIVGPSGAGKSTLLNALAGRELSPTGRTRPTTREVVVYAAAEADAAGLVAQCGAERVRVATDGRAAALEYLILVDTPDTNTLPENQALLRCALERADLLLAVLPAHNPRMHDNITFLRPYVQQLPADAVVPVLNMVDRVPEAELANSVAPDARRAVAQEWGLDGARVYLVAARAVAPGGEPYPADERPLHGVNEFAALRDFVFAALNRAEQVVDRRLARVERLLDLLHEHGRATLAARRQALAAAAERLRDLGQQGEDLLAEAAAVRQPGGVDVHAALYGLLAGRWWGPVGWLVAAWALVLRVAAFLGRPSRWFRPAEPSPGATEGPAATWAPALEGLYARGWPPVADLLVRGGFDPTVRQADAWGQWVRERARVEVERWSEALTAHLDALAQRLSAWPLQVVLNAPSLGLIGWIAYDVLARFWQGRYLPADYFRHAGIAVLLTWALSFLVFQVIVAVALRAPLRRGVVPALAGPAPAALGPLEGQLQALAALEQTTGEAG